MKAIIWTSDNGRMMVTRPQGRLKGETDDEVLARVMATDIPKSARDVQAVDESEIPADRTFRNAWKANGRKVEVDMPKAREIAKGRTEAKDHAAIEAARTPEELKAALPAGARKP